MTMQLALRAVHFRLEGVRGGGRWCCWYMTRFIIAYGRYRSVYIDATTGSAYVSRGSVLHCFYSSVVAPTRALWCGDTTTTITTTAAAVEPCDARYSC